MRILAFMFTASGIVSIGMATNLPRLFAVIGASPAAGIAAASLMGPAQVVARILEYSARRRVNPLLSAKVASALHPIASIVVTLAGAPAASLFAVIHGAGNGMLTIVRGTLPLAIFGPAGYGARIGQLSAPARIGQALAPFAIGLAIDGIGGATLIISSGLSVAAFCSLFLLSLPRTPELTLGTRTGIRIYLVISDVRFICRAKAYRQSRCCIRPGRRCLPRSSRRPDGYNIKIYK